MNDFRDDALRQVVVLKRELAARGGPTHNLNDTVEVVLTDIGAEIYNKYYENSTWREVNVSEGHIPKDQLWSIMQIFGKHFGLGGHVPFKECLIKFV